MLPLFLSLPVSRLSRLLTQQGGGGGGEQIIRPRESMALYKSFNTLWRVASSNDSENIFVFFTILVPGKVATPFPKLHISLSFELLIDDFRFAFSVLRW